MEDSSLVRVEQSLYRSDSIDHGHMSDRVMTSPWMPPRNTKVNRVSHTARMPPSATASTMETELDESRLSSSSSSWWKGNPFHSYYTQLAWGRICSLIQPALNHQFSGSEIMPGLWISDHASVCDLQALQDRDIRHIVCAVLGVKAQFPKDIQYTRLPLRDTTDEDIFQFFDFVAETIHNSLRAGHPILVHCRCGVSRSVTLVCAYLIRYHDMSHEQAIRYIQQRRPCANPILSFRHQLRSYAERHSA